MRNDALCATGVDDCHQNRNRLALANAGISTGFSHFHSKVAIGMKGEAYVMPG